MSKNSSSWIKALLPYLKPHRKKVFIAFGAAIAGMSGAAFIPVIERDIINNSISSHKTSIASYVLVLLGVGLFSFVAAFFRRFIGGRLALDIQFDLRNAIYSSIQKLDLATFNSLGNAQLISRSNSDLNLVQGLFAFLPMMSGNVAMLVISLIVMITISPLLALVMVVSLPLLAIVALRLRTSIFPATWLAQQDSALVSGVVSEAISGVRVVRALGQQDAETSRLVEAAKKLFLDRVRVIRTQARLQSSLQAIPMLSQVAVLALGGWLALRSHLSIGTFLLFSSYIITMVAPVRMFAGLIAFIEQARAGVERILEVISAVPLIVEKPDALDLDDYNKEIVFNSVSFSYRSQTKVLQDFSLKISPGESVAIVGKSGSGKSTLSLLLARFYDVDEGEILIGGINIKDLKLESLRRHVGIAFEESFLFSDTVRSNISYGNPTSSDEQIRSAAIAAGADDFIQRLPQGYDTVIGEKGLNLSGGQRQRIALARALLTNPQLLILDDATSAIDSDTESQIHENLSKVIKNKTTILIAHRRSTLSLANRIVVLEDGKVQDQGTHEELLLRNQLYRDLLQGPILDEDDLGIEDLDQENIQQTSQVRAEENKNVINKPVGILSKPVPKITAPISSAGAGGGFMSGVSFSPTPELLKAVDSFSPVKADPKVDIEKEASYEKDFRLSRFIKSYRGGLIIGVLLIVADALLSLAGPFLIKQGIDKGVINHSGSVIFLTSAIFGLVAILDWIVIWFENRFTGQTGERLLYALRIRIFSQLQRLPLHFYETEASGKIMTRMLTDIESLSTLFQNGLITALVSLFSFVGVAIVLFVLNVKLALVAFLVLIPLGGATYFFRKGSSKAYSQARESVGAVNASLFEGLAGVKVSQAYRRQESNIKHFVELSKSYLTARLNAQYLVALYFPFVRFLSDIAAVMILWIGGDMVRSGAIKAGAIVAFLLYLEQFFSPIQQLSQTVDNWQQAKISIGKINQLMSLPVDEGPSPNKVVKNKVIGNIELEKVSFTYPGSKIKALDNLDFKIKAGEFVALVGETGAGKSTIMKLIGGLYLPDSGRVLIDGFDLRDFDPTCYHSQLGYVPQDGFLFSGSISYNIAYGRPGASQDEIEQAAKAVHAEEVILNLPNQYEELVGQGGTTLSQGQAQLIALARAYLIDPSILLLDEATANLDLVSEAQVARAIGILSQKRTTLMIAHRLPTARLAKRIVVLGDGKILEQGSHQDLLAMGGKYSSLWKSFESHNSVVVGVTK